MRNKLSAILALGGLIGVLAILPQPAVAGGWAGKAVNTFKATAAGETPPKKTPLPLMFVVPEDTLHVVCLNVNKSWLVNKGKVVGKAGAVWRANAAGTLEQIATFTLAKKKVKNGLTSACKDVGPLEKGDLVEIQPKFSALGKTVAPSDKLLVNFWQPTP